MEDQNNNKIRRTEANLMWSGELDADLAAAEACALSPGTVEDMFAKPEDVAAAYEQNSGVDLPGKPTDSESAVAENRQKSKKGVAEKVKEKLAKVGCIKPREREGEFVEGPVGYVHGGPVAGHGLAAPAMTGRPVGTHDVWRTENVDKLVGGRPDTEGGGGGGGGVYGGVEAGNADGAGPPKKEGVLSKVIDKLHLGTNRP